MSQCESFFLSSHPHMCQSKLYPCVNDLKPIVVGVRSYEVYSAAHTRPPLAPWWQLGSFVVVPTMVVEKEARMTGTQSVTSGWRPVLAVVRLTNKIELVTEGVSRFMGCLGNGDWV